MPGGCLPAGLLRRDTVRAPKEVGDLSQQHASREQASPERVEQEQQERLVVAEPHRVGDPHACTQAAGIGTLCGEAPIDHGREAEAEGAARS